MANKIGRNALIANPALKPFEVLIGAWQTTGWHPYFPGVVLTGRTIFEWHENGAFLIMRSEVNHPKFPDGIEIFGSDDSAKTFFMMHFDERGISRKFDVQISNGEFVWQRTDAKLSQRYVLTVQEGCLKTVRHGKMIFRSPMAVFKSRQQTKRLKR